MTEEKKINEATEECCEEKTSKCDKKSKKELASLKEENEKLIASLAEEKDKYRRLAAEYDNFRRRTQKEKEQIYSDSYADVIEQRLEANEFVLSGRERVKAHRCHHKPRGCRSVVLVTGEAVVTIAERLAAELFDPKFRFLGHSEIGVYKGNMEARLI